MVELECWAMPMIDAFIAIEEHAFDNDWNLADCEVHAPLRAIHWLRAEARGDSLLKQEFVDGKNVVSLVLPSGTFKLTPTNGDDILVKRHGDTILVAKLTPRGGR